MKVMDDPPFPARPYSETIVAATGSSPPSPRPEMKRKIPNSHGLGAMAHSAVNTENPATLKIMDFLRPITSVTVPTDSDPINIPTSASEAMNPAHSALNPHGS